MIVLTYVVTFFCVCGDKYATLKFRDVTVELCRQCWVSKNKDPMLIIKVIISKQPIMTTSPQSITLQTNGRTEIMSANTDGQHDAVASPKSMV